MAKKQPDAVKYKGYVPAEGAKIDRVKATVDPKEFHKRYIAKRQPVIIEGLIQDEDFKAAKWTDLGYLKETAGSASVKIEPIDPDVKTFGTAAEKLKMPFSEFIDKLTSTPDKYYLTTQYDEDGEPSVLPPPMDHLATDFPLHPKITGNLVLQQTNLWIGNSSEGTSSGLHHDFHDNIYCLLRGKKRFVLYPPSAHPSMYTYGELDTVHQNGLISYTNRPSRADGLTEREAAQEKVDALEERWHKLEEGADEEAIAAAEEAFEDAMGELAMLGDEDDEEDLELGDGGDDFEESESDGDWETLGSKAAKPNDVHEEESSDEEDGPTFGEFNGDDDHDSEEEEGLGFDIPEDEDPVSFSTIPVSYLHNHLDLPTISKAPKGNVKDFPLLKTANALVGHLEEGEMLYLPASWFHEVTSSSSKNGTVHMAFNYWFHPPDGSEFKHPYNDRSIWERKLRAVEQKAADIKARVAGKKRKKEKAKAKRKRKQERDAPLKDQKRAKLDGKKTKRNQA
ncbi:Clavaminate synthase-like protein [Saitoella complicata NRRL Y-17804]|nr:Clavaminate synthase-like protein [Saitoella complicata NRRL Y-17804]ODQ52543.1 Clavaminate synthase-like protein [Saitoella complicata NRRL Y-17804]GAO52720.1 hypothetical protein G7K_6790-t1 [Saitoella complicata NRRL Y-17804]